MRRSAVVDLESLAVETCDSFGTAQRAWQWRERPTQPASRPPPTIAAANQLSGYNYDLSGNLLADGIGNFFQYDANGMVTEW